MFPVGDGVHRPYEGRTSVVKADGFPALDELMEGLVELGGEICIRSARDQVCVVTGDDDAPGIRRPPAIQPLGTSAVLADMTEGRCVTF